MPMKTTGTSFSSFGVSCHRENSFRNPFRGKNDEVIKCSIGERTIRFSVDKFSGNILDTVRRQSAKNIDGWVKDEQMVYPSRVINQEIDNYCLQRNEKITTEVKQRVFSLVSQKYQLSLDIKAAQSSINHVIMGNASFGKKIDALCDGMSRDVKNRTSDSIANLLADKFYQKHIDSDIDIVKLRNEIPDYLRFAIQA
ncbi:bfpT-regulated chaperone [Escherichia coli]|uniref:BfpT-regulated chaperone n=3 Tax=Enterobacteriaceae TaxID=543 RepID=A0A3E1VTR3_ECOLX|nr:bfpT-regulated chaperone [Escherichia coli]EES2576466.1 bfpT-regulated chaperone [Escherichia coli O103:H2]EEV1104566.1 bfpT-regulated chaperone [Escherichia coli O26:H11]EFA7775832.1 bfpT-regulated chaperone [Escherichia coli O157:H7]EFA8287159.1 bfpT-regulated chaperone [Escherichia coli O157]EFB3837845.1 bfpT-regulated chaperone [Escherichia coli O103]EFV9016367.1 bfpT-regulated chaperone [Shigella sonnei]EFW3276778.1 bfpT-regulated chaperone [Shigella flexneri]EJT2802051.1 bfpT-regul